MQEIHDLFRVLFLILLNTVLKLHGVVDSPFRLALRGGCNCTLKYVLLLLLLLNSKPIILLFYFRNIGMTH